MRLAQSISCLDAHKEFGKLDSTEMLTLTLEDQLQIFLFQTFSVLYVNLIFGSSVLVLNSIFILINKLLMAGI